MSLNWRHRWALRVSIDWGREPPFLVRTALHIASAGTAGCSQGADPCVSVKVRIQFELAPCDQRARNGSPNGRLPERTIASSEHAPNSPVPSRGFSSGTVSTTLLGLDPWAVRVILGIGCTSEIRLMNPSVTPYRRYPTRKDVSA